MVPVGVSRQLRFDCLMSYTIPRKEIVHLAVRRLSIPTQEFKCTTLGNSTYIKFNMEVLSVFSWNFIQRVVTDFMAITIQTHDNSPVS